MITHCITVYYNVLIQLQCITISYCVSNVLQCISVYYNLLILGPSRPNLQQKGYVTDAGPQMTFQQKPDVTDAGPQMTYSMFRYI